MIKLKLAELKLREDAFQRFMDIDFPIAIGYKLSKLFKIINEELSTLRDLTDNLIKKYGEQEGNQIRVAEKNQDKFAKEYAELLEQVAELKVNKINIKLSQLGDISLPTKDLALMDVFIEIEDDL